MRPGPKIEHITRKPCCIKYCRHRVIVKTNSCYHRPERSSNKSRILQTVSNLKKKTNLTSLVWMFQNDDVRREELYREDLQCSCIVCQMWVDKRYMIILSLITNVIKDNMMHIIFITLIQPKITYCLSTFRLHVGSLHQDWLPVPVISM